MRKFSPPFLLLTFLLIFSCSTDLSTSDKSGGSEKSLLLKNIGESKFYSDMVFTLEQSTEKLLLIDLEEYNNVYYSTSNLDYESIKLNGIPQEFYSVSGAVDYINAAIGYKEAIIAFDDEFPQYESLSEEEKVEIRDYYNQSIGYTPTPQ